MAVVRGGVGGEGRGSRGGGLVRTEQGRMDGWAVRRGCQAPNFPAQMEPPPPFPPSSPKNCPDMYVKMYVVGILSCLSLKRYLMDFSWASQCFCVCLRACAGFTKIQEGVIYTVQWERGLECKCPLKEKTQLILMHFFNAHCSDQSINKANV